MVRAIHQVSRYRVLVQLQVRAQTVFLVSGLQRVINLPVNCSGYLAAGMITPSAHHLVDACVHWPWGQ
ncbi:hypothetical protein BKG85_04885 [Mycobacteroides chelonae]|nr:hypothetical protein BKG85_04885 [Mycobacteroides chelonae]